VGGNQQFAKTITSILELSFEPIMLGTANRMGRSGAHQAPVENVEVQGSS
jgi:hypothetical protein